MVNFYTAVNITEEGYGLFWPIPDIKNGEIWLMYSCFNEDAVKVVENTVTSLMLEKSKVPTDILNNHVYLWICRNADEVGLLYEKMKEDPKYPISFTLPYFRRINLLGEVIDVEQVMNKDMFSLPEHDEELLYLQQQYTILRILNSSKSCSIYSVPEWKLILKQDINKTLPNWIDLKYHSQNNFGEYGIIAESYGKYGGTHIMTWAPDFSFFLLDSNGNLEAVEEWPKWPDDEGSGVFVTGITSIENKFVVIYCVSGNKEVRIREIIPYNNNDIVWGCPITVGELSTVPTPINFRGRIANVNGLIGLVWVEKTETDSVQSAGDFINFTMVDINNGEIVKKVFPLIISDKPYLMLETLDIVGGSFGWAVVYFEYSENSLNEIGNIILAIIKPVPPTVTLTPDKDKIYLNETVKVKVDVKSGADIKSVAMSSIGLQGFTILLDEQMSSGVKNYTKEITIGPYSKKGIVQIHATAEDVNKSKGEGSCIVEVLGPKPAPKTESPKQKTPKEMPKGSDKSKPSSYESLDKKEKPPVKGPPKKYPPDGLWDPTKAGGK